MLTSQDFMKIRGIIRQENKGFIKRDEVREIIRQENKDLVRKDEVRKIIREETKDLARRDETREMIKKALRPIKKDIKLIIRFFDYDVTYLKQRMNRVESVMQLSPLPFRNGAEL